MENTFLKKVLMLSASLLLLAVTACVVLGFFRTPWFENIQAQITNEPYTRSITVSAEGKVNATPDIAIINLSVVTEGKTVGDVTQEGNTKMTAVIDAIKSLEVEAKDITSTQYNLSPRYFYPENRQRELSGYSLTQNIQVKVRDLTMIEDILDGGVAAGANQVGQLSFDIDDPSEIKKQAREKAFDTAKEKAEEMAKAAGVKLGRVVTFSEGSSSRPPVYANYAMDVMEEKAVGGASATIEAGSTDINITVSVTYEIE
jgi:uncharacterized protein YggE